MDNEYHPPKHRPALLLAFLALFFLGLITLILDYTYTEQKSAQAASLKAIADLKSQQIGDWLGERMKDARMLQSSPTLPKLYANWRAFADAASFERMTRRLAEFAEIYQYSGIMLLDQAGAPLWHSGKITGEINAAQRAAILNAAASGQVSRLGPYRDARGRIHLDFVLPLRGVSADRGPIVILHTDMEDYLPATLRTWPVPTESGEIMLFRRVGEAIEHLNESRHAAGMALQNRLSLSNRRLLSAQVMLEPTRLGQLVEGEDHRGQEVMGVVRSIAGTDWYLVAKVDRAEVMHAIRDKAAWITLTGLLGGLMAALMLYLARQRQGLKTARAVQQAQEERLRALRLLGAIADGSTDAIFAKDRDGRYVFFNRQSEVFSGKQMADVLGRDDTALLNPEQAKMVMAMDHEVVASGQTQTYQYELILSGITRFLSVTKGPLKEENGRIIGIFGIARDISSMKRAEAQLRATAEFVSILPGPDFFANLVRHAAHNLGLDYVHVGLLDTSQQRIETLAAWLDDGFISNRAYDLYNTPCAEVLKLSRQCIEMDVQAIYPDDADLRNIGAQGYVGEPLVNRAGEAFGLIVGVTRLPLRESDTVQASLRILAARAAAEWESRQDIQVLSEREHSYRLLTEQLPAILYRASLNEVSQTLYISPRIGDLGYSPEEWLADPNNWVNALHPDDRDRVLDEMAAWQIPQGTLSLQYRMQARDGRWFDIQDEGIVVRDKSGKALYLQGLMRDVTAQRATEAALQSSRARADLLADVLNRAAQPFTQGFPDGRLGIHNQAYLNLVGYTEAELTAVNWGRDLTPPEWRPVESAVLEELHRTSQPVTYEKEYIRKDGSRVPIELLVQLIRDTDGKPYCYFAFISDISERKGFIRALENSEEQLRFVLEGSALGFWDWNITAGTVERNERWALMLGYSQDEMKNTPQQWTDFIHPDDRDLAWASIQAVLEGSAARHRLEYRMLHKDGSVRWILDQASVMQRDPDGKPSRMCGTHTDITERKRHEMMLAAQIRRADALLELSGASESLDEAAFMQHGLDMAETLTGSSIAFIHFVDEDQETIELVTWSRSTLEHYCQAACDSHYPISQAGIWADALRQRAPVVFNDYPNACGKHGPPEGHATLERLISVPVIEGGLARMMAGVGNKPQPYDETDVETVQLIAESIWRIVSSRRSEAKLKQRNADLERFNRVTAGREVRMVELKREINALARKLGQPEPYPLDFLNKEGERSSDPSHQE